MKITVRRDFSNKSPYYLQASNEKGHTISLDAGVQLGGLDSAFRPMELIVVALISCATMDILSILNKGKQQVTHYQVEALGKREENVTPAIFSHIHLHFDVVGKDNGSGDDAVSSDDKDVFKNKLDRAIKLSLEKYCSVSAMLKKAGVKISYTTSNSKKS